MNATVLSCELLAAALALPQASIDLNLRGIFVPDVEQESLMQMLVEIDQKEKI